MKFLYSFISFLCISLSASTLASKSTQSPANDSSKPSKKILMVVSGYGVDQGETKPGYEFDEFSKAYLVFKANGLSIDIASPKGGLVVADKYNDEKPFNAKVLNDLEAMAKINNTLKLKDLEAKDYAGIFIVGGKGAMFDLPKDQSLKKIIADIYDNQGSVSAVCHGPAALVDVKLANGKYLVSGKRVNGFTNKEEKAFGKKWVKHFDFLLEDKLKERGGVFESSPLMLAHTTIDGRLITGQNPFSTVGVAEALVESIGIVPTRLPQHKDDKTMKLVSRLLESDKRAKIEFNEKPQDFQPELIAMYGYYSMQHAENKKQLSGSVALMELASPFMNHPKLSLAIADGHIKLENKDKAKKVLKGLLANNPELEDAQAMLQTLN